MRYCGISVARGLLQLCVLAEERVTEPPIRLPAIFYEPGPADAVAQAIADLESPVIAVGAPLTAPASGRRERMCDRELRRRGLPAEASAPEVLRFLETTRGRGVFTPGAGGTEGSTPQGAYRAAPIFETSVEGVFCALLGRRLPAKRHPLGIALRIERLRADHVVDEGGDLWHRRIEEIEAAAAALAAHRYAVGHAWWIGDPAEGVIVLPGSRLPEHFTAEGVLPPVQRVPLGAPAPR